MVFMYDTPLGWFMSFFISRHSFLITCFQLESFMGDTQSRLSKLTFKDFVVKKLHFKN